MIITSGGGFAMQIQDRQGRGAELLAAATDELVAPARKAPGLTSVFSPFTANTRRPSGHCTSASTHCAPGADAVNV